MWLVFTRMSTQPVREFTKITCRVCLQVISIMLTLVERIVEEMNSFSEDLKEKLPQIYSKELLELLFFEFYTKISYIEDGLRVSRKTAVSYLKQLEENNFLSSQKIGRERVYCNDRLFNLVKESNSHK